MVKGAEKKILAGRYLSALRFYDWNGGSYNDIISSWWQYRIRTVLKVHRYTIRTRSTMEIRASKRTINRLKQIQSLLDQLNPDAAPQALIVPGSPVPQGTIIVFPGSFNPPTNAHLALMSQARQYVRSHLLSAGEKNSPVGLYAAMSRHIVDKEAVERPSLL